MQTQAFTMKLKPGFEEEYKKRHDEIWPELQSLLNEAGIEQYHIFLDEKTGTLFAFQTLKKNHTTETIPQDPIVKKWWAFMADIMETNPDNSPIETPLKEVFELQN
ncbi:L-rhamnose mutarotase [Leeuwenhoekiella aestuarii]|uniref:L-rhamnose mutarotase n=1 Tax=Leeuwenhoekiella aestuarii TaxID=2249426 RepID=A0A4Q0NYR4_9FLAO|nr:L-rhamnose mutarotase [Leeuwenhoekiella aestuarii]RXG12448.1 L-rhamnose mutarotase [Leeuwenhoekiella aestuarii]RXG16462.1 L-rhamnose mutarotase [Leeuwenhoekiella aestuarii]